MASLRSYKPLVGVEDYLKQAIGQFNAPINYGEVYDVMKQVEDMEEAQLTNKVRKRKVDQFEALDEAYELPEEERRGKVEDIYEQYGDLENLIEYKKLGSGNDTLSQVLELNKLAENFPELVAQESGRLGVPFTPKVKQKKLVSYRPGSSVFEVDAEGNLKEVAKIPDKPKAGKEPKGGYFLDMERGVEYLDATRENMADPNKVYLGANIKDQYQIEAAEDIMKSRAPKKGAVAIEKEISKPLLQQVADMLEEPVENLKRKFSNSKRDDTLIEPIKKDDEVIPVRRKKKKE